LHGLQLGLQLLLLIGDLHQNMGVLNHDLRLLLLLLLLKMQLLLHLLLLLLSQVL